MHSIKKSISIGSTVCLGKKPFTEGGVKEKSYVDSVVGWDGETSVVWKVVPISFPHPSLPQVACLLEIDPMDVLLERLET